MDESRKIFMGGRYSKKRHKPRISKSQIPWLLRGAIRSNNVETLQYLFSYPNGVDPSMVIDGVCPLNLAVELGYLQMVKILIKAGADICVADTPRYPLHQASIYGRNDIAELLIRSGASVSALTERRQSCLHLLAHQSAQRYVDTALTLLKYNINPNTLDDDGLAPLHRASIEIATILVAHEPTDVNVVSRDGDTPVLTAVKDRRESVLIALIKADQLFYEQQQQLRKQPGLLGRSETQPVAITTANASTNVTTADENYQSAFKALRTPSSKSCNSATSRLTLASATSAVLCIASPTDCGVLRASSAASVNLHSTHLTGNSKSGIMNRHHRTAQFLHTCQSKTREEHDTDAEFDTATGFKLRSCLTRLSGKLNAVSNRPEDTHPTVTTSSYSGSYNLYSSRRSENCQRCHSVGNPSDVAGWWQSCDRGVQRILGKTSTSTNHPVPNPTTIPPSQSISGSSRPRLDLDRPDKIGMTPLMIAAEAGSSGLNMAMALVNAGCNVTATDKVGMTALHHACYVGSLSMVRFLMERIQPNSTGNTNPTGQTTTLTSVTSHTTITTTTTTTTTATISPLPTTTVTTTNTNPSGTTTFGSTVKLTCVSPGFSGSPINCANNPLPGRLVNPELLNLQDKYGRTLIYLAACRGHSEVVNYLLCHSADLHIPNKEHKSPLYISAYFGYLEIANALLRHGAQVDQTDSHRKTPLYVATYHGRSEIVDLLLAAGANVNAADKNGKTPLYVAVLHGHLALAHKLLDAGASVNCVDHEGLGPLHMAVKFPKLDIPMVKLLLNHGCDPVNLASFTRWLLMHGIIPDECIHGDDELAQWLQWEECNVRSLKRICRVAIQRALGHTDSLRAKVNRLPLPDHLLSYVSMKEL